MKTAIHAAAGLVFAASGAGVHAQANKTPAFPMDRPMTMRAIEAVCTGISSDARNDPRWASYPLKIEMVGASGEFLGDAQVTLSKGDEAIASINCGAPWVLFKLMPGAYSVSAEIEGVSKSAKVNVAVTGQARVILRFTDAAKR